MYSKKGNRYINFFYIDNLYDMARARVAKPGQRRKVEGLVTQVFEGSNPFPRILLFSICQFGMKITFFRLKGFMDRGNHFSSHMRGGSHLRGVRWVWGITRDLGMTL